MKSAVYKLLFIGIAISNINGQIEPGGFFTDDGLSDIEYQMKVINSSIMKDLDYRHKFQKVVLNLEADLAQILTSVYLKEYINNLEEMDKLNQATNTKACSPLLQNSKRTVEERSLAYFKSCVSHFENIEAFEEPIWSDLTHTLEKTKNITTHCKKTGTAESSICINRAKLFYLGVISDLSWILERLQNDEFSVDVLTECITNATNIATNTIRELYRDVRNCIIGTSEHILIDYVGKLVYSPQPIEDVFIGQAHFIDNNTEQMVQTIEDRITDLNNVISKTIKIKSWPSNNVCERFTKEFNDTVDAMLDDMEQLPDINDAALCIANYGKVHYGICINRQTEMERCIKGFPDIKLKEVLYVEKKFNHFKNHNKIFRLTCLGNVKNLFPVGGIHKCIKENSVNDTKDLSHLDERFHYFLQDSRKNMKILEDCVDSSEDKELKSKTTEKLNLKKCFSEKV